MSKNKNMANCAANWWAERISEEGNNSEEQIDDFREKLSAKLEELLEEKGSFDLNISGNYSPNMILSEIAEKSCIDKSSFPETMIMMRVNTANNGSVIVTEQREKVFNDTNIMADGISDWWAKKASRVNSEEKVAKFKEILSLSIKKATKSNTFIGMGINQSTDNILSNAVLNSSIDNSSFPTVVNIRIQCEGDSAWRMSFVQTEFMINGNKRPINKTIPCLRVPQNNAV